MHTASFCKYDYLKLVLSAPPRLVDAHARLGRAGSFFSFGSMKGQAQSRRTLRPRWCCEEALPFRTGTVFDTAPLRSFPHAISPRARRGQPQHKQPIDSPRAPYRQPSHICHRLNPCPLPTCNRSRPAQTMIKLSRSSPARHRLSFQLNGRHLEERRSTSCSSTSPKAVAYSWSTRQLLGHPRGLVGVSEVRKAQTYGRDPRNGHSTIYCISKAGTIYQASEPMYELLMQNMRALEQVGRGETCDRRDDSPTKADAGPARRQPRAERSRACSSRPCVVVGGEPAVRRCGRGSDHAAPGRPPRPTSPLRRRSPRRSRHSRRASACFRRSVPHRPWTWLRAALHRPDDGAVARPAAGCAAAVDSLAPDVAAASEGVLLRCSAFLHQRAAASGAAFYHLDVFAGNFCRVGLGGAAPVRARGPGARLH